MTDIDNGKCKRCDSTGWIVDPVRAMGLMFTHNVYPCSCVARFRRSVASFKRATAFLLPERVPPVPPLPIRRRP